MKRIIVLILLSLVILFSVAYSEVTEEFTIHSGITFGMTPEEVISCETSAGFEVKENESAKKYTEYYGLYVKGTIAGIKNVTIYYTFDYDKGLIQADYRFPSDDTFNTLEKALTEKYGETEYSYITRKAQDKLDIGAHGYVFSNDSSRWSHRIIQISDSLTIAIDHHLDELLSPKDVIVYTALSEGEAKELTSDELGDL